MSSITFKIKHTFIEIFKPIKWGVLIFAIFILVGFILGMIFGFSNISRVCEDESLIENILKGSLGSLSSIFYRIVSLCLILLILCLLSKCKFLLPFALLLICYRAYLLGLNIAILLSCYGLIGIIMALLYLPIELALLIYITVCYFTLIRDCIELHFKSKKQFILISIAIIVLINILLLLILFLLSPKVIFVL